MSQHMIAYYQAATANAALAPIPAVADGTVRVIANDVYVPKGMANIVMAAGLINSIAATIRVQMQSPSLRASMNYDIQPVGNGLIFGTFPERVYMPDSPLQVAENEPLELWVQNGAAVVNQGIVMFSDGAIAPVKGRIFTVRATGAASLSAGVWVNTAVTFGQGLPAGHYQCVGFHAVGANLVAARIFFSGSAWRPGVLAVNTSAQQSLPGNRLGQPGVLGEFDNTTPPTVDCFGVTDTAQEMFFDLIKTT